MSRILPILLLAAAACGKPAPQRTGTFRPLTGTLDLGIDADPAYGTDFWAILTREGTSRAERIRSGERRTLEWREELGHPREWKLKLGPSRHPGYRLVVAPGGGAAPSFEGKEQDAFHDPKRALAVAYFAIPLDGTRSLSIPIRKPAPLEVKVLESNGAPAVDVPVVAIPGPRYHFLDGFEAAGQDSMQLASRWAYFNFDPEPHQPDLSGRWIVRRTGKDGLCRFEEFTGWVGISERSERHALPRNVLAGESERALEFVVHRPAAKVRIDATGLPGPEFHFRERGFILDGFFPLPPGRAPQTWRERVPFVQGDHVEVFTPCPELRLTPLSRVHRIKSGALVPDLQPGWSRRHEVALEVIPHRSISGVVILEDRAAAGKEHCRVELEDAAGTVVDVDQPRGGAGVPADGRVPFTLRVLDEGPFALMVRTGSYPVARIEGVKAPREGIEIRVSPEPAPVSRGLRVLSPAGTPVAGAVAGSWSHRAFAGETWSGTSVRLRPGLNTVTALADEGVGVLRDVPGEAGGDLEIRLVPGTALRGRLLGADGAPVAGVWVHAAWPEFLRMPVAYRWLADRTDADGRFEIRRVPPGPWRLYAHGDGRRLGAAFTIPGDSVVHDLGDLRP